MPTLSICIPTFNRARRLRDCLHSVARSIGGIGDRIEVCVSDNGSIDDTASVVGEAQRLMPIAYQRHATNLGIPRNFLSIVDMAHGEFVWLVGDDDLLTPTAAARVLALIDRHPRADFFFVNAFDLPAAFVDAAPSPFDVDRLPAQMKRFAPVTVTGEQPFLALIDRRVSFDFLGAMFLSVFRRERWQAHRAELDPRALTDSRTFSHFDNTFPHLRIFAPAFCRSLAAVEPEPVSVTLSGAREWAPMYPLVRTVRLVEALALYRRHGLPWLRYVRNRNTALKHFLPDLIWMWRHRRVSGFSYINPVALLLRNALFPNVYLSALYYAWRKAREAFGNREAQG